MVNSCIDNINNRLHSHRVNELEDNVEKCIKTIAKEKQILFFYFSFLGPHLWHMEVPRLGAESELQLLAYTTAHGNARCLTH